MSIPKAYEHLTLDSTHDERLLPEGEYAGMPVQMARVMEMAGLIDTFLDLLGDARARLIYIRTQTLQQYNMPYEKVGNNALVLWDCTLEIMRKITWFQDILCDLSAAHLVGKPVE